MRGDAASPAASGVIGFLRWRPRCARASSPNPRSPIRARDSADDLSARPDFAVLMYPVIATTGRAAHAGSASNCSPRRRRRGRSRVIRRT